MILPHDGEQLLLGFNSCYLQPMSSLPWGGLSPRVLTRSYKRYILKAQAPGSMRDSVDPDQYDLWPTAKKAIFVYEGAPLLGAVEL